jgi:hypothetical protein
MRRCGLPRPAVRTRRYPAVRFGHSADLKHHPDAQTATRSMTPEFCSSNRQQAQSVVLPPACAQHGKAAVRRSAKRAGEHRRAVVALPQILNGQQCHSRRTLLASTAKTSETK